MNNKRFQRIAGLVMTLAMILGNIIPTQAASQPAATAGPSVYWGALIEGRVPSNTNLQGVFATFETRSNKKMSIIHWGQPWVMPDGSWGEFQTGYFDNVRNRGSIPMINWASQKLGAGINQPDFQLRDIYNGTYDAYIQRWATGARNWGHPFFLYFNHEMNGWWLPWAEGKTSNGVIINGNSPGDFVKAWRHVHDIFTAVGATNVSWVWGPNHMSTSSQYPALSTLYPGDAYVDWTGLSVYNKYNTWAGLHPLLTGSEGMNWFRNSYNEVLSLAPNKPMMLAQWASIEAGDGGAKKAAWITDALTTQIPVNFPKIKAIVWLNWMETPNETYPIESSPAATAAWAAGIASPVYAANQYANLNKSPIPPPDAGVAISGSVGIGGVTLSYTDGTAKTITSGTNGTYSVSVPTNWSGTVSPSHACYTFNPSSLTYNSVTADQANKNYSATLNPAAGCAGVDVKIKGDLMGRFGIPTNGRVTPHFPVMNGPVNVISTNSTPVFASERVHNATGFINELMGVPSNQLTTQYWFPWYDNVSMKSWILVGNPSTSSEAHVRIYIAGVEQPESPYTIPPGSNINKRFSVQNGPVKIVSDINVFASERVHTAQGFVEEMMGMPDNQLSTEYWFPWYDNVSMKSWILVGNPSTSSEAHVRIYIAGVEQPESPYTIPPGKNINERFDVQNGPVKIVSDINVFASERVHNATGFINELMGVPSSQLTTQYWFPWYDNQSMRSWILVGNPSTSSDAHVRIYIAGVEQSGSPYTIPPGARITPQYPILNGPVKIVSDINVFASERVHTRQGFVNEVMGIPNNQLTTQYWFPWYDNQSMRSWILIGKP